MSETARTLVSVEQFLAIEPDDAKQFELLDGVVYTSPRPRPRHGRVESALSFRIGGPFDQDPHGPGGWWILPEALVRWSPHDATPPDLAGWRRERVPEFPEALPIEVVPDWACEILSPSSTRRDRTAKTALYARCGVRHLWIVDPAVRTVEAYANQDGRWLLLGAWGDGDVVPIPPFEAVALDVGALFPPIPAGRGPDFVAEEAEAAWNP